MQDYRGMKTLTGTQIQAGHNRVFASEKGVALIIALIFTAVSLAIMSALLYMILSATQVSGIQKRYKTALEASFGGKEVIFQAISARGNPLLAGINLSYDVNGGCMGTKLLQSTYNSSTGASNWGTCDSSLTINPNDQTTYDMKFTLGTSTQYTVYAKIVNTVEGNSGADLGLVKTGVVNADPGEINVMSIPYLYTVEVDAENAANPMERAKLSILYQY